MHKGINFTGNFSSFQGNINSVFGPIIKIGNDNEVRKNYEEGETAYKIDINKYWDQNGNLSGQSMEKDIFPSSKAEIFLSHSHDDVDTAKELAFWLKRETKQDVFIDEYTWGSANSLLKQIIKLHKKEGSFQPDSVCRAASTVYMILANAISSMIHKCHTFIFLNTTNSIYSQEQRETFSPWIYYELQLFNSIVENEKRVIQKLQKTASLEGTVENLISESKVSLPCPFENLLPCTQKELEIWRAHKLYEPDLELLTFLETRVSKK